MKITTLNTTDTYRLADREGYLSTCTYNNVLIKKYPQILTGFKIEKVTDDGEGILDNEYIISYEEYNFFEVVNTPSSVEKNLWDGISPVEVGMTVKASGGHKYRVNYINKLGTKLSVSEVVTDRLLILNIDECKAATKPEKEETFDKVKDAWNDLTGRSARLTRSNEVLAGEMFDVVYSVMNGVIKEK